MYDGSGAVLMRNLQRDLGVVADGAGAVDLGDGRRNFVAPASLRFSICGCGMQMKMAGMAEG
jgi:hypothetical protein